MYRFYVAAATNNLPTDIGCNNVMMGDYLCLRFYLNPVHGRSICDDYTGHDFIEALEKLQPAVIDYVDGKVKVGVLKSGQGSLQFDHDNQRYHFVSMTDGYCGATAFAYLLRNMSVDQYEQLKSDMDAISGVSGGLAPCDMTRWASLYNIPVISALEFY